MNWKDKEVLITGGTGSLGNKIVDTLIEKYQPKGIRIFSRDELKQWEMRQRYSHVKNIPISFLVGDIRDYERVKLAFKGVNIVIHAAALKQIPSCEANPLETIKTNINGTNNIFVSALENKVEKVMAVSTDKACYPVNLYGATKLCMEKLFIQGNVYSGGRTPHFSCVRYGNVLGSRGSVVPLFRKQYKETGKVTITSPKMTRFWITLKQVSDFILQSIEEMKGGEIFIPKMPSATITTILEAVVPEEVKIEYTGIRPGEKLHETLITAEESLKVEENETRLKIMGKEVLPATKFEYRSNINKDWLNYKTIREMLNE